MVRIKKRYMVLQLELRSNVTRWSFSGSSKPLCSFDNSELSLINERLLVQSIGKMAKEMFGEVGNAQIAGLRVVYVNKVTGLVLVAAHHGQAYSNLAAIVPLINSVGNVGVVAKHIYTGATVQNCYKRMDKYQCDQLRLMLLHLGKNNSEEDKRDAEMLTKKMKDLRRLDNLW